MRNALHSALAQSREKNNEKGGCKRKRKVCFSAEADNIFYLRDVAPASAMTDEERYSAWYTNEDMIYMKEEANILARRLRIVASGKLSPNPSLVNSDGATTDKSNLKRLDEVYPTHFPPHLSAAAAIEDNANQTFRGLELRIFLGRQLKKYLTYRTIMEYQHRNKIKIDTAAKNGDPNLRILIEGASRKLGYVSAKCSRWARDMALATGRSDFETVHEHVGESFSMSCGEEEKDLTLVRKRTNEFSDNFSHKKLMIDAH